MTGEEALARATITEVEALAAAVSVGPSSELGRKLANLATVLGSIREP